MEDELKRTHAELERTRAELRRARSELATTKETLRALIAGEIDAAIDDSGTGPTLLQTAQEELRSREGQLRAVFEGALEAMLIADDQGYYLEANPAAEELFGVPREEILGKRPTDFGPDMDDDAFERSWRAFLEEGRTEGTFTVRRPNGELRTAEFRAKAHISPGRNLSVLRDRTDALSMEHRLVESNRLESLGRLAGGVAHDFNNMLSVIVSFGTFLQEEIPKDDEKQEFVKEILDGAQRASYLVQQLLAFGRRQLLSPRPVLVRTLLRDVVRMTASLTREDVSVVLGPRPESAAVEVDATQMEQVLVNLVLNARDAISEGGAVTVDAELLTVTEGSPLAAVLALGPHAVLRIADDGDGMDEVTASRIFEPFFSTKEGGGKGTGLGLATAYGIVKQSGGHIDVESAPGHGSTFRIYLPLTEKPVSQSLDAQSVRMVRPETRAQGEVVLLVEDEDAVRRPTAHTLRQLGYEVLEAATPGEALLIAEQVDTIHLLLSDMVMPRMSGARLAERLLEGRPELKVLFISGYASDDLDELPEHAFLAKPFKPKVLAQTLRDLLDD